MAKKNLTVQPADGDEPAGPVLIERAILDLAQGMKKLTSTRLKQETIVTLLNDNSGVSKNQIRLVLNNLADLEALFLKPKRK